ncbi:hypothetical protein GCM10011390_47740 [Aureimonas endophytica]|uniref:Uncharacterized protein n=1 Tax=Aureimonas endophytica TaxID=2027858 RepID=A0A917A272_9HYPH|nr:hypothetical protein GCM10011390_47740 [Aureimonas endophytica]
MPTIATWAGRAGAGGAREGAEEGTRHPGVGISRLDTAVPPGGQGPAMLRHMRKEAFRRMDAGSACRILAGKDSHPRKVSLA